MKFITSFIKKYTVNKKAGFNVLPVLYICNFVKVPAYIKQAG